MGPELCTPSETMSTGAALAQNAPESIAIKIVIFNVNASKNIKARFGLMFLCL